MSDIVTRLWGNTGDKYPGFQNLNTEAAAEITRLRDELAAWKAVAEKRHNILFDLAWAANVSDDRDSYCLGCDTFKGKEHGGGCVIARAIAQSECAATDAIDPCDGDQEGAT